MCKKNNAKHDQYRKTKKGVNEWCYENCKQDQKDLTI
jgi:hypothetical protein